MANTRSNEQIQSEVQSLNRLQQARPPLDSRIKLILIVLCLIVLALSVTLIILLIRSENDSVNDSSKKPIKPDFIEYDCQVYSKESIPNFQSFVESKMQVWNLNATFNGYIKLRSDDFRSNFNFVYPRFKVIQSQQIDPSTQLIVLKSGCLTLSFYVMSIDTFNLEVVDIDLQNERLGYLSSGITPLKYFQRLDQLGQCVQASMNGYNFPNTLVELVANIKICS